MNYPNLSPSIARTDDPIRQLPTTGYGYVRDFGCEPALVYDGGGEYELPDPDAYAKRQADSAAAFLEFALDRSRMQKQTLILKSLHSLAFTLRHRCNGFCVPSKAVATAKSERQKALWKRVGRMAFGTPLKVEEVTDGKCIRLVLSHGDVELGEVQSKWLPVVRPLLPWGTGIRVVRITGHENEHYRLGLNICFTDLANSIAALNRALGTDLETDDYGSNGASQASTEAVSTQAQPVPEYGGDGAANGLRLVSLDPSVAKPQAGTKPDDIVLYREIDGTAQASIKHVVRHSPTGLEWGYQGCGPADLARSILLQFTDEATAEGLYQRFKTEVITAVPIAGGVIRAADVRTWLAANAR